MMERAASKLRRELGGRFWLPHEYWLLTMNDASAEPVRRDAAALALAEYTYHKPVAEQATDDEAKQVTFAWALPDHSGANNSGDTAAISASSATAGNSRVN